MCKSLHGTVLSVEQRTLEVVPGITPNCDTFSFRIKFAV